MRYYIVKYKASLSGRICWRVRDSLDNNWYQDFKTRKDAEYALGILTD
jgi:hypothetical protein